MADNVEFQQALANVEAAEHEFINGNAIPFKACWSHADDVTIFGAFGAYEQGWKLVGPRLDWAAARYRGGHLTIEPLGQGTFGALAYTIWLERQIAHLEGQDTERQHDLRVTQVYRREEGVWKVIHRHADAIIEKSEATADSPR